MDNAEYEEWSRALSQWYDHGHEVGLRAAHETLRMLPPFYGQDTCRVVIRELMKGRTRKRAVEIAVETSRESS